MKLNCIPEAKITESIHTTIFVDFDETLGHISPNDVDEGIEVIKISDGHGTYEVAMRHGWKSFLHALNNLEHRGDIYIYSAGGGQLVFPTLFKQHKDLNFISVLTSQTMIKNVHSHSILIDDNPEMAGVKFGDFKAKKVGLTPNNIVEVSEFHGQMENGLSQAFADTKKKIAELEAIHQV